MMNPTGTHGSHPDTEGEPIQIFQNLPAIELEAGELADMKRSVHELLRSKAIDAEASAEAPSLPDRDRSRGTFLRRLRAASSSAVPSSALRLAAAFGGVVLAASLLVPSFAPQPLAVSAQGPGAAYLPSRAELAAVEALPLVENLGSDIELIQIEDDEMSVVVAAIQ